MARIHHSPDDGEYVHRIRIGIRKRLGPVQQYLELDLARPLWDCSPYDCEFETMACIMISNGIPSADQIVIPALAPFPGWDICSVEPIKTSQSL
jgi:hypothetical protein